MSDEVAVSDVGVVIGMRKIVHETMCPPGLTLDVYAEYVRSMGNPILRLDYQRNSVVLAEHEEPITLGGDR